MTNNRACKSHNRPPLDDENLRAIALAYVSHYASSAARLRRHLERKLAERGWQGASPPDLDALVARFAELRYVDDDSFAEGKARTLERRGYGPRRIRQALSADGIDAERIDRALTGEQDARLEAADRLARRRRIGPYASQPADAATRQRQIGIFLRAGHDMATALRLIAMAPGESLPVDGDWTDWDGTD